MRFYFLKISYFHFFVNYSCIFLSIYKINNEYKFNIAIRYQDEDYNKLYSLLKYINDYFAESFSREKITITIDNSALDYM